MIPAFMTGPSILMYHSIADNSRDPSTVSVRAFREQIAWLAESEFEVVALSFLNRSIRARNLGDLNKKVVITFDDGCEDFMDNALPILLDHKATATVFLVTQMLGGKTFWKESKARVPLMSEDQVRTIKAKGMNLGSHTATHANLPLLDDKTLQQELKDSYDALTRIGESFYALAYPWGQWSEQVVKAAKAIGYECALTVEGQMQLEAVNPYILPRVTMRRDMDLRRFRSLLMRTRAEMKLRKRYRAVLDKVWSSKNEIV